MSDAPHTHEYGAPTRRYVAHGYERRDCDCGSFTMTFADPLWVCLCGARNRLRDTTCRACGDYKPEAHK